MYSPAACCGPFPSLQLLLHHDDGEVLRSATAYLRTLLQARTSSVCQVACSCRCLGAWQHMQPASSVSSPQTNP